MALDTHGDIREIIDIDYAMDDIKYCKICGAESPLFAKADLGKSCHATVYPLGSYGVDIPYYQCSDCHFIFTQAFDRFTPEQWSRHIYNDDYVKVDPAFEDERPRDNAYVTEAYLRAIGGGSVGLDYGGGSGLAASILRGRGWAFDNVDPFNGVDHVTAEGRYDVCTAFEVFEHVTDPQGALAEIRRRCSPGHLLILLGTNISDGLISPRTGLDWWYAGPRNGHISLYSRAALKRLAAGQGLHYFSLGRNLHFLSRGHGPEDLLRIAVEGKLRRILGAGAPGRGMAGA